MKISAFHLMPHRELPASRDMLVSRTTIRDLEYSSETSGSSA